jgi:hypothetical protein
VRVPIKAVVYVSVATAGIAGDALGLHSSKLCELVDDAARFNLEAGVTGVVLFDGARFLQYIEGPADGVDVAYSRVLGSSSHSEIMELHRGNVATRRLPFWPMKWLPAEAAEVGRLATADWTGFKLRGDPRGRNPTAIDFLTGIVSHYASVE